MSYAAGRVMHDADSQVAELPGFMRLLDSCQATFARTEPRIAASELAASDDVRRQLFEATMGRVGDGARDECFEPDFVAMMGAGVG